MYCGGGYATIQIKKYSIFQLEITCLTQRICFKYSKNIETGFPFLLLGLLSGLYLVQFHVRMWASSIYSAVNELLIHSKIRVSASVHGPLKPSKEVNITLL